MLLPAALLLRRCDIVEVIGRALVARAAGWGQRRIVALLRVPRSTLRGWLARFADRAEMIRSHFVRWALWLSSDVVRVEPSGSLVADAVDALVMAADVAVERLVDVGRWQFVAAATGGRLLCNTSAPFPAPWQP